MCEIFQGETVPSNVIRIHIRTPPVPRYPQRGAVSSHMPDCKWSPLSLRTASRSECTNSDWDIRQQSAEGTDSNFLLPHYSQECSSHKLKRALLAFHRKNLILHPQEDQ